MFYVGYVDVFECFLAGFVIIELYTFPF